MTNTRILLVLCLCLIVPGWAAADDEDPDQEAAHVRHALMEVMGWNITPLGAMSTGKQAFDAARAELQGERIVALAGMIPDIFARDTSGADVKTAALPDVWRNRPEFEMKAAALADAANDYLAAAAESEAAAKKAFVALGDACKSCHEKFKSE